MADGGEYQGFKVEDLQETIQNAETLVIDKLKAIKEKASDEINIGDMFDMQWMMNKFSQLSELSSSVLASAHGAVQAMTRNIK
jgi:hypothetical protein